MREYDPLYRESPRGIGGKYFRHRSWEEKRRLLLILGAVFAILFIEAIWLFRSAQASHATAHYYHGTTEEDEESGTGGQHRGGTHHTERDDGEKDAGYDRDHELLFQLVGRKLKERSTQFTWSSPEVTDAMVHSLLDSVQWREIDAIVVVTGGAGLPLWVRFRLEAAKRLQETIVSRLKKEWGRTHSTQEPFSPLDENGMFNVPTVVVSGAGSPHHGPIIKSMNGIERIYTEATEGCEYLRSIGYEGPLLQEAASFDTLGQAFFLRTTFGQVVGWRRAIIITSEWHLVRTRYFFDLVWNLKPAMMTQLIFLGTAPGAPDALVHKRHEIETVSLNKAKERFGKLGDPKVKSFRHFAAWLFVNHTCYDEKGPRETSLKPLLDVLY